MRTLLLLSFLLESALFVAVSLPLIARRVRPNPWYGFRVPKTLNNPDIWYKANAYAGRLLLRTGVVFGLTALALYPILTAGAYAWGCLVVLLVGLALTLVFSFRYLSTL